MNTLLAVLTGGGIAAAGGLMSGWLNNWMGGKRDERAHELGQRAAREALGQERLDRTYTELGIFLSRWGDWSRSVHPLMGPVRAPEPMPDEERWRIETLVENHGSPEVRRLLDLWGQQRKKIQEADIVISSAEKSQSAELTAKADQKHLELRDDREALYKAAAAIRNQMRKELAGQQAALERIDHTAC